MAQSDKTVSRLRAIASPDSVPASTTTVGIGAGPAWDASRFAPNKGNGTTKHYNLTEVITVLVKENPKMEGSAARKRFALYKSGMSVEAAFAAGVWAADIRHDSKREHIKLGKA